MVVEWLELLDDKVRSGVEERWGNRVMEGFMLPCANKF